MQRLRLVSPRASELNRAHNDPATAERAVGDQGEGDRAVGVAGVFRELVRSGGVGVLFQGATARVLWLMAFTTVYLQVYEMLTRETPPPLVPLWVLLVRKCHDSAGCVLGRRKG